MKFQWAGNEVSMHRLDTLSLSVVDHTSVTKEARKGHTIFAICVAQPTNTNNPSASLPDAMKT